MAEKKVIESTFFRIEQSDIQFWERNFGKILENYIGRDVTVRFEVTEVKR